MRGGGGPRGPYWVGHTSAQERCRRGAQRQRQGVEDGNARLHSTLAGCSIPGIATSSPTGAMSPAFVAYYRVSTNKQAASGLGPRRPG